MAESAESLQDSMRATEHWPQPPIADLSGGKDSRVIAAAAISAGVTSTVRTVRTDHGEVEVAESLVNLSQRPLDHIVEDVKPPKIVAGGVLERLMSHQRLWEGHYLARSVYKAEAIRGLTPRKRARLNGLGGESIQGGELMDGPWREKINQGGQAIALSRLNKLVNNPRGSSKEARETTSQRYLQYASQVSDFGWTHPEAPMNFVYNTDRMPHWSIPIVDRATIIPFYAPKMLLHMARTVKESRDYGDIHRALLNEMLPEWSNIPFYKPSQSSRATALMWEFPDWQEARALILSSIGESPSFSETSLREIIGRVDATHGETVDEVALIRFAWEITFAGYIAELSDSVRALNLDVSWGW